MKSTRQYSVFYNLFLAIFLLSISVIAQEWQLVWSDEFDNPGLPDASKWGYDVGGHGWGNNELQYYKSNDSDNARVENGRLIIQAHKENFSGSAYTSARLVTRNRGDWLYGRIEVMAKLPAGRGTWPAIWMLPTDWVYGGWPRSGEVDIMEHVGFDPGVVHGTVHTEAFNHSIGTQQGRQISVPTFSNEFHEYAAEWYPHKIDFFVDDTHYFTFRNLGGWEKWPFDKRFHLLLNIAVGGTWGGAQGVDDSIFPVQMEIDYVRIYEDTNQWPTIAITSPTNNAVLAPGSNLSINVDATDPDGTIQQVNIYQGDAIIATLTEAPYQVNIPNVSEGCYTLKSQAIDDQNGLGVSSTVNVTVGSCARAPYLIAAAQIPGRIEAEHYDLGGQSSAFSDTDPSQNNGNSFGNDFRIEEGVDTEICTDTGGGYNVGWIEAGEWLRYIVDVQQSGTYQINFRVAAAGSGGRFRLEVDGADISGSINVSSTGGWQNWVTKTVNNVQLSAGTHTLRFVAEAGGFNLNYISFDAATAIEDNDQSSLPLQYQLEQNFPNPFNPTTQIIYSLPVTDTVLLEAFNTRGQKVATLVDEKKPAGQHSVQFDGGSLSSGVYIYRLTTANFLQTRKMLLLR